MKRRLFGATYTGTFKPLEQLILLTQEPWNGTLLSTAFTCRTSTQAHAGRTHAPRHGECPGMRREHRRPHERTSVHNAAALAQQLVQGMQSGW
eukprot:6855361-Alexandrium_andersonii.AAC.1